MAPTRVRGVELAVAAAVLAAGLAVVFGGALRYYFSQDDFQHLARAAGLLPALFTPYRPVASLGFFPLLRAIAGLAPVPYHVASLVVHASVCLLAYGWLRRFHAVVPAAAGTAWFAVHPALYTALYWVSAINVPLMWLFALLALHAERARGPRRWLALPWLALALLTRETAVAVPLLVLATRAWERSLSPRDPVPIAMVALAAAYAAWLAALDVFGVRGGSAAASAYHMAIGGHMIGNLLSYAGWAVNAFAATVRGFSDAIDPDVFAWGWAALALWSLGAWRPALRRGGWILGGAWFVIALLPVLPLAHHTYHYYLYGPLLGVSWCIAAAWSAVAGPGAARSATGPGPSAGARPAGRAPLVALAAVAALWTWNGAVLVHSIETHPFVDGLRADATVDRALIAQRALADLSAAGLPDGTVLKFWSPTAIERDREAGHDAARESYWEQNVREALFDGLAVRLVIPQVRRAEFVRAFAPSDTAAADVRYAVYRIDGTLGVARAGELQSMLREHPDAAVPGALSR